VAGLSDEELLDLFRSADLDDLLRLGAKIDGCIVEKLGGAERQETFRRGGATTPRS
jgi:hypothetical protein